jgi:cell division protein FtsW
MTLPLVSYGGSSLIGTALTLGLALALIRRARPAWKKRL